MRKKNNDSFFHLSDLKQDSKNARKHNPRNIGMIEQSLRQVGAARSGVIDENGVILAGNGTYDALAAAGIEKVRVVKADGNEWVVVQRHGLTEEQKRILAVSDNRSAELAEWDGAMLEAQRINLEPWFTTSELAKIGIEGATNGDGPEPQFDKAEALRKRYGIKSGQIWQLGKHRLMCGDCTDLKAVERMMGREKVDCVFTSPPYNQGNSSGDLFSHGKRVEKLYKHSEDNMTDDEYMEFIFTALDRCAEVVSGLHSVVWNMAYNAKSRNLYGKIIFSDRNPFQVFESIVWNKGGAINLPQVGIYSRSCEFVYVMAKSEKYLTSQIYGDPRWNYWETTKVNQSEEHKATFPIEFAKRAVTELSLVSSVVYDPFAGSGTTLIACEQLNRRSYAMEISPTYVAVAIQRWVDLTKKEPKPIS